MYNRVEEEDNKTDNDSAITAIQEYFYSRWQLPYQNKLDSLDFWVENEKLYASLAHYVILTTNL